MEAEFFLPGTKKDPTVHCLLCPRRCSIAEGKTGFCRVRRNRGGRLIAVGYAHPVALQVDPIEKKPLAYWKTGSKTFSVGCFGCNLGCLFCQNDSLSRSGYDDSEKASEVTPEQIVTLALKYNCQSISLTYNEPTTFFEYACNLARSARQAGLGTVLVSNGWISPEARSQLYPLIDAANIDIKGFSEDFYHRLCAGTLAPVLESCRFFAEELHGHLEITNLVIPGENDSDEMIQALLDWVDETLGKEVPLHFSAYFPAGGFTAKPTPPETLLRIRDKALARGFSRVQLGNLH
ncbi:MAG: AmmeMemoRadiSam system radical SAM enzyme [Victivallaceae bacterium]|nr:AmmeMemoRadiSam system radical SAM enzyme [Victivallaceae bacterium]